MKRFLLPGAVVVAGLILASCATLSQEQCETGDWRSVGFNDGTRGRPAGYVSNHADACSQYGIAVDAALYTAGRTDGLRQYCRPAVAERTGRSGDPYFGVCEGELGAAFSRVHAAAREVHDVRSEADSLDSEIRALIARLSRPDLPQEQIAALTRQLRGLELERQSLQLRLRLVERRLADIVRAEEARLRAAGIVV